MQLPEKAVGLVEGAHLLPLGRYTDVGALIWTRRVWQIAGQVQPLIPQQSTAKELGV